MCRACPPLRTVIANGQSGSMVPPKTSTCSLMASTAATRVSLGLQPLGPSRTLVAGIAYDLTDAEAVRVADFIASLIAARDLD